MHAEKERKKAKKSWKGAKREKKMEEERKR